MKIERVFFSTWWNSTKIIFEKFVNKKFTSTYISLTICPLELLIYLTWFKRYEHSKNPVLYGGDCMISYRREYAKIMLCDSVKVTFSKVIIKNSLFKPTNLS